MRVAFYLRRSTDDKLQADSINAQHALLTKFAREHDHVIVDDVSFHDNASGRTARRAGFQKLIAVVQAGAPFDAVLVRDVSRWGRFANVDEAAFWEFYFSTHNVRVIYADENFRDSDPYVAIQKMLRRFVAAEFSRDKARNVQFGHYRARSAGFRSGGNPPFGMKRMLVEPDGTPIQLLARGERKSLNSQRVKLVPGEKREVEIVRRIFRLFTVDLLAIREIVRNLNSSRVRPQLGGAWTWATVRGILRNAAYAGAAAGVFRASENFSEQRTVLTSNAWRALVPLATWQAAQERLAAENAARATASVARRFAQSVEDGDLSEEETAARRWFEAYDGKRFIENDEARLAELAAPATLKITARIGERFEVAGETDGTLVLNGLLRIALKMALPMRNHLGGVSWKFQFSGSERQDVTIGVALSPTGLIACCFHIVNARFGKRPDNGVAAIAPKPGEPRTITPRPSEACSIDSLLRKIERHSLLRYSRTAHTIFYNRVSTLPFVNTAEVGRSLGWPASASLAMYNRIKRLGYPVPSLKKQQGRRLDLVCEDCGFTRRMLVCNALQRENGLCRRCSNRRKMRFATCPDCGVTRQLKTGAAKRLSHGTATRCRGCNARANGRIRTKRLT